VNELDLWRAAKLLIDVKGAEAPAVAQERVTTLRRAGDEAGARAWVAIAAAISELRRVTPGAKDGIH
jgi:hypothetical protein